MPEDTILCMGEGERFPRSAFEDKEGVGLVHLRGVSEPHTILGDPLEGSGVELNLPDAAIPPDDYA